MIIRCCFTRVAAPLKALRTSIVRRVTLALRRGGDTHERWLDYLDSLSPIMTDDMGASGGRFAATFAELLSIIIKAGEAGVRPFALLSSHCNATEGAQRACACQTINR